MAESTQSAAQVTIAERDPLDEVQQTQAEPGASGQGTTNRMNSGNGHLKEAKDDSHDASRGGDGDNVQGVVVTDAADLPEGKKKKSKKRNKPASKRGLVSVADLRLIVRS